MSKLEVLVIGAGASGMMAAIRAAQLGSSVTLAEKNPTPGKKLLLCGKGRCNLTNACSLEEFLSRFSRSGEFLRDAFKVFFNDDLMAFFLKRGVPLEVERQNRVFPRSGSSGEILDALIDELTKLKVRLNFDSPVETILTRDGEVTGVRCLGRFMPAGRVILATGGLSYPGTGSTGDGLAMARHLGHRVIVTRPGLVPLDTFEKTPAELEGLTLKNIRITFRSGKRSLESDIGELVFTDTGVSGPLVLSASGRVVDMLDEKEPVYLSIDLKPALSKGEVDKRLQRECVQSGGKAIKTMMESMLPKRMVAVVLEICGIAGLHKVASLTREQRSKIVESLKGFRLRVKGSRTFREAMITRGGISLKEIDPRTMQSRLIKGLYFCGEIIDVDADTGGFNLQAAFSTGYLAGSAASKL